MQKRQRSGSPDEGDRPTKRRNIEGKEGKEGKEGEERREVDPTRDASAFHPDPINQQREDVSSRIKQNIDRSRAKLAALEKKGSTSFGRLGDNELQTRLGENVKQQAQLREEINFFETFHSSLHDGSSLNLTATEQCKQIFEREQQKTGKLVVDSKRVIRIAKGDVGIAKDKIKAARDKIKADKGKIEAEKGKADRSEIILSSTRESLKRNRSNLTKYKTELTKYETELTKHEATLAEHTAELGKISSEFSFFDRQEKLLRQDKATTVENKYAELSREYKIPELEKTLTDIIEKNSLDYQNGQQASLRTLYLSRFDHIANFIQEFSQGAENQGEFDPAHEKEKVQTTQSHNEIIQTLDHQEQALTSLKNPVLPQDKDRWMTMVQEVRTLKKMCIDTGLEHQMASSQLAYTRDIDRMGKQAWQKELELQDKWDWQRSEVDPRKIAKSPIITGLGKEAFENYGRIAAGNLRGLERGEFEAAIPTRCNETTISEYSDQVASQLIKIIEESHGDLKKNFERIMGDSKDITRDRAEWLENYKDVSIGNLTSDQITDRNSLIIQGITLQQNKNAHLQFMEKRAQIISGQATYLERELPLEKMHNAVTGQLMNSDVTSALFKLNEPQIDYLSKIESIQGAFQERVSKLEQLQSRLEDAANEIQESLYDLKTSFQAPDQDHEELLSHARNSTI